LFGDKCAFKGYTLFIVCVIEKITSRQLRFLPLVAIIYARRMGGRYTILLADPEITIPASSSPATKIFITKVLLIDIVGKSDK
jgi:hypothetical protein